LFRECNKNGRKFSAKSLTAPTNNLVLDLFNKDARKFSARTLATTAITRFLICSENANKNARKFSARTLTATRITRFLLLQFY
jgi:hypothetical protein